MPQEPNIGFTIDPHTQIIMQFLFNWNTYKYNTGGRVTYIEEMQTKRMLEQLLFNSGKLN